MLLAPIPPKAGLQVQCHLLRSILAVGMPTLHSMRNSCMDSQRHQDTTQCREGISHMGTVHRLYKDLIPTTALQRFKVTIRAAKHN